MKTKSVDSSPYSFEPEEDVIWQKFFKNISVQIFRALLDSGAGEQAARMTAMDNATRNAGDMIKICRSSITAPVKRILRKDWSKLFRAQKLYKEKDKNLFGRKTKMTLWNGNIIQILGAVVDVQFTDGNIRNHDALTAENDGKTLFLKSHSIWAKASFVVSRWTRLMVWYVVIRLKILAQPLPFLLERSPWTDHWCDWSTDWWTRTDWRPEILSIHREAQAFSEQATDTEQLITGIKVIDLLCPYSKVVEKLVCSVVLVLTKLWPFKSSSTTLQRPWRCVCFAGVGEKNPWRKWFVSRNDWYRRLVGQEIPMLRKWLLFTVRWMNLRRSCPRGIDGVVDGGIFPWWRRPRRFVLYGQRIPFHSSRCWKYQHSWVNIHRRLDINQHCQPIWGRCKERITSTNKGSITSVPGRLCSCWWLTDPAPATAFSHLDATTVLSRQIAELGIYPAVDPLDSTSRILDPRVVGEEHYKCATDVQKSCKLIKPCKTLSRFWVWMNCQKTNWLFPRTKNPTPFVPTIPCGRGLYWLSGCLHLWKKPSKVSAWSVTVNWIIFLNRRSTWSVISIRWLKKPKMAAEAA